jgi:hypothetical protein
VDRTQTELRSPREGSAEENGPKTDSNRGMDKITLWASQYVLLIQYFKGGEIRENDMSGTCNILFMEEYEMHIKFNVCDLGFDERIPQLKANPQLFQEVLTSSKILESGQAISCQSSNSLK